LAATQSYYHATLVKINYDKIISHLMFKPVKAPVRESLLIEMMTFKNLLFLVFLLHLGVVSYGLSLPHNGSALAHPHQQKFFNNPIIDELAADPCVIKLNGLYYLVYTQGDRIDIVRSPILSNFNGQDRFTAYRTPFNRANLWAPELHLIRGGLYIYFTMDDGIADENHRMYVIQANDPKDPFAGWSSEIR
jgi:hypothetical protein